MRTADVLKKTPLFSRVEIEDLRFFAENSCLRNITKETDLFLMGDRADAFFLVISGWIKLYRLSREGEEVIINIFAPGETFAEAAVFSPVQRYPVCAQAVEDAVVLEIPRSLVVQKIRENSDLALMMLGSISARQRLLVQQIEQITARSAAQRIGVFLLRLCTTTEREAAQISLPYDKSLIARRLNLQPETFSRALSQLKPYGVIMKKRDIFISNTKKLAEYCDLDDRDSPC